MGYVKVYNKATTFSKFDASCYEDYDRKRTERWGQSNYGAHAMKFTLGELTFYFSYRTLVALKEWSTLTLIIRKNDWGHTTGRHLSTLRYEHARWSHVRADLEDGEFTAIAYNMLVMHLSKAMAADLLNLDMKGYYPDRLVALETGEVVDAKNVEGGKEPNTKGRANVRRKAALKEKEAKAKRKVAAKKAAATRRHNQRVAAEAAALEARIDRMQKDVFLQVADLPESML